MLKAFIRPKGQYIPWFGGFQRRFVFEMTAMKMWWTAATGCYAQQFIMPIRCLTRVPTTGHLSDRSASKPAPESIPATRPQPTLGFWAAMALLTCHSAAETINVAFGKQKATRAVRTYAIGTSSATGALVPAGAKSSSST